MPRTPLYNRIGNAYDGTRCADSYIVSRLLAHLQPMPRARYLDVACGTGNYTTAVAKGGGHWSGVDQSLTMIDEAAGKSRKIEWMVGDVMSLPLVSATVDGALCVNAIHHFSYLAPAFTELRRVLRPRAPVVVFSAMAEQMERYWLNAYFPDSMARSIRAMPTSNVLAKTAAESGFSVLHREPYAIRSDVQDGFLYSGKHDPVRYLNHTFRAGISTFASIASAEEVSNGCARLAGDIESGRFLTVAARFENDGGDYAIWLFEAS